METTRQYVNEAALSVAKLLGIITRMTDDEIDEIIDHDEAEQLAETARRIREYAVNRKAHIEGRARPLQDFINDLKDTSEPCPYCGQDVSLDDMLECPGCGRPGCCTYKGGCMPGGNNCLCPTCEEGDEE
jgi:hypothetical protein